MERRDYAPFPIGQEVMLESCLDGPVLLKSVRQVRGGYECRVRLSNGKKKKITIMAQEAASLRGQGGRRRDAARARAGNPFLKHDRRRISFRRRLIYGLSAICASLVILGVGLEVVVRLGGWAPELPEQYRDFMLDPYLPYAPKPNTVRTGTSRSKEFDFEYRHNSKGMRDVEHSFAKPKGVFRILLLGDSYTYGIGADFEQTFGYQLERRLNRRGPGLPKVEIIKAGVPRYFTEVERLQLEHYGVHYEPDLVLVGFTSNDVPDTVRGMQNLKPYSKEGYLLGQRSQRLGPLGTWLYLHSHAARRVLAAYLARTEDTDPTDPMPLKEMTPKIVRKAYDDINAELDRMYEICQGIGAKFAVINIPRQLGASRANEIMAQSLSEKPYMWIDLQPYVDAVAEKDRRITLFWPRDRHCTPNGYAVFAQALFIELTGRGLVPN